MVKESPHAPKDVQNESLNKAHKSWQGIRDYILQWGKIYSDPNKGWILSTMDGLGAVSKAVAMCTMLGVPYNIISFEIDPKQWEAAATDLTAFIDREEKKV